MKKLITMIGAAAAAFGLYADTANLEPTATSAEADEMGYEDVGKSVLEADEAYWYMAESAADAAVVKAYGEETAPNHTALYAASPDAVQTQAQYIGLDSEAPVYRTFAQLNGQGTMDEVAIETAERGGIIADQLVKFSAFEDDPADLGDAKIAVWVKTVQEEDGDTPAVNHLMISTAALSGDDFSPTLTNIDTEVVVDVANWHQLKITAIQAATVSDGVSALPVHGFVVELDGVVIAKADGLFPAVEGIYTAQGTDLIAVNKLFPSMIAYNETADAGTLRGIAFKGTGAIDDITVAAAPVYTPPTTDVAEIEGKGQYATLADAFAAAVDDDTITVIADCSIDESINVAAADRSITLDATGYTVTCNCIYPIVWGDYNEENAGTLTIVGGTFQQDTEPVDDLSAMILWTKNGKIKVTGGTFSVTEGEGQVAYVGGALATNGSIEVTGGVFTICDKASGAKGDVFNVQNTLNVTQIQVFGGSFSKDLDLGDDVIGPTFVAPGYECVEDSSTPGLWTVQKKSAEVDPTVINLADIPAGTKVSEIFTKVPSEFADVDAKKFATWCQKEGNESLVGKFGADAQLDAFLLDCLNSTVEIEKAKAAFVIVSITQNAGGDWIVLVTGEKGQNAEYGNGYVNIIPATEIPAVEDVSAFFKAELTIAPANQD